MGSVAAPPSFPCPYTAGGCPLFNTIELPKPQTPSCSGGCSPPALPSESSAPSPLDPSRKLRPISPYRAPTPSSSRPPSIELASAVPSTQSQSAEKWNAVLELGLSPSEVDLAPLYVPFPQRPSPQPQPSMGKRTSSASSSSIWDIEELVPPQGSQSKKPRFSSQPAIDLPPPRDLHFDASLPAASASDRTYTSPAPCVDSEESFANEVVTPFISKLQYLLDHPENDPWIRWDSTGTYVLIAHSKPHLLEILARYFRHTTSASFVRQLNIYGFKRMSTVQLLSILESSSLPISVSVPIPSPSTPSTAQLQPIPTTTMMTETFSASDYSAFHHPKFFKSTPGKVCRLGGLKPIVKERAPRNRSKKAKAQAQTDGSERKVLQGSMGPGFA
ncbi:heat shock factor family protein [Sporobolomyces salmoneus]|uniref:heat shock factor family protein n=1 Tax=Sporobolomyces salmoneus TaxID=183962 RepID=UPI00316FB32D